MTLYHYIIVAAFLIQNISLAGGKRKFGTNGFFVEEKRVVVASNGHDAAEARTENANDEGYTRATPDKRDSHAGRGNRANDGPRERMLGETDDDGAQIGSVRAY